MPTRYSRHYYDVYRICSSEYINEILEDKQLLNLVTNFKIRFYNNTWANYNDVLEGKLKIIPQEYRFKELLTDYNSMSEMIVGKPPKFEIILDNLKMLEITLNKK